MYLWSRQTLGGLITNIHVWQIVAIDTVATFQVRVIVCIPVYFFFHFSSANWVNSSRLYYSCFCEHIKGNVDINICHDKQCDRIWWIWLFPSKIYRDANVLYYRYRLLAMQLGEIVKSVFNSLHDLNNQRFPSWVSKSYDLAEFRHWMLFESYIKTRIHNSSVQTESQLTWFRGRTGSICTI